MKKCCILVLILAISYSFGCLNIRDSNTNTLGYIDIYNQSSQDINVTVIITDSNEFEIINNSFQLSKSDMEKIEMTKRGNYHFFIFVDQNRTIEKDFRISREYYPPQFIIKNDEISFDQKVV